MASRRIISLAQRLEVLHRISRRYVGWRFEEDELVNQMWLSPYVRAAEFEHQLARAGRNAMFDYFDHELRKYEGPSSFEAEPTVEDVCEDVWMDWSCMSSNLNRTQKLVIKLKSDWFTMPEISKIVGLCANGVRHAMKSANLEKMKKWAMI